MQMSVPAHIHIIYDVHTDSSFWMSLTIGWIIWSMPYSATEEELAKSRSCIL